MTAVDQAVEVMDQAAREIERLREINAELLEACRLALSGTTNPWIEPTLKAAIAKAEGRS